VILERGFWAGHRSKYLWRSPQFFLKSSLEYPMRMPRIQSPALAWSWSWRWSSVDVRGGAIIYIN